MSIEERLAELGETLPNVAAPAANYVPAVRTGNLVFTAGQLPTKDGRLVASGHVGAEISVDEAAGAARVACLNALAAVKSVIGNLDAVERVVRVTGYVNSAQGFVEQATVLNGASDLLVDLFGERGRHSRAAIGMYQLPRNAPVEVDLIVEVR